MAITALLAAWYGSIEAVLATREDSILPVIVFVSLIAVPILLCKWRDQYRFSKAEGAYYNCLEKLKRAPNDPEVRAETVRLGRKYAMSKGSTFNETTLMTDLFAACARATIGEDTVARVEVTNPEALTGKSVAQEIEKLGQLFLKGVITAEEFERGKTLFLGTPVDKAASAVELLKSLDALKRQGVLSQSEFNMKKWEILSERLLPGKRSAAGLR